MHVEPPEGRIESLKDFFAHYLMIVLSILTALGLEEGLLYLHHREAGREALARIDAEVAANLQEVRETIADNERRTKPIDDLAVRLTDALRHGEPDARIRSEIIDSGRKSMQIGASWVQLRNAAWDVAVADQSASYIDPQRLVPLSRLYSVQRDFMSGQESSLALFNGSRMVDTIADDSVGDVSPRELLHSLKEMEATIAATQSDLHDIESLLVAASGQADAADAGKRASAPAASTSASASASPASSN